MTKKQRIGLSLYLWSLALLITTDINHQGIIGISKIVLIIIGGTVLYFGLKYFLDDEGE